MSAVLLAMLAAGVAIISTGGLASPDPSSATFSYTTNSSGTQTTLDTTRAYHTATLLTNGMVLLTGGNGPSGAILASAELYNPSTGTFTPTGSMNTARTSPTATLLANGMVLIAGGYNSSSGYLASAELYNPSTGTFTPTGSMNTARSGQTATVLSSGLVLMAGGYNGSSGVLASAELYNPSTETFSYTTGGPSTGLNTARGGQTATLLNNGMVLMAGGYNSSFSALASAELYNPSTGTFSYTTGGASGGMNTTRYEHTATLLNSGLVLMAGGTDGINYLASAELYNPSTGTFAYTTNSSATQTNLNTGRSQQTATLLNNGTVLIAGGAIPVSPYSTPTAELYDPVAGTFTYTGSLNAGRYGHTATLLLNGMVLATGGEGEFGILASAELYEPATFTPPNLASIAVSPSSPTIPVGTAQIFTATGTFSGGGTQLLASVTWSSSDTAVASITDDASNPGAAYALANGSATVSACAGTVCGSTTLTVSAPVAGVSPASLPFAPQDINSTSASLPVTLSNTGNASLTISNIAPSANFGVTTGSNACGSSLAASGSCTIYVTFSPTATGTATGTLTITDNSGGVTGSTQTVSLSGTGIGAGVVLDSIAVTPANPTTTVGNTQQFTATGTYSDGSTQNLTSTATWTSSATGVATIGTGGLAIAVGPGQTTIEAASGSINGSTTLTVFTSSATFAYTGGPITPRLYHTATLLNDGTVLIVGGVDAGDNILASAELYNPATGTFTYTTGSMNTARYYHTATLLDNGMVLIAGGDNGPIGGRYGGLASAELYNPATGTFSLTTNLSTGATTSLNYARAQHTATVLPSGLVLLAGGNASASSQVAVAELYNPATGIFTPTASLNANRYAHTATLLDNGMVLLAGGFNYGTNVLTSAELYNPANGSFTYTTGSLKTGRYYHTGTLLNNGMVLMAGGSGFGVTLASAELYNPSTGTFSYTTNGSGSQTTLTTAREWDTATLLNNGTVLIAGGYGSSFNALASAELYDPVAGTFTATGSLNAPRFDATATLLANGMVLVAGGAGSSGTAVASAELYEPATLTPPNLVSIALSPSSPTVPLNSAQSFTATGTFSGSSTQQLASVAWSSSNTAVASITDDVTNLGAAYGLATGSTTVSACAGSVCGSTTVTVTPAPVAVVSPTTLPSFGPQLVGTTSAPQPVTLSNTGTVALAISSIVASANFAVTTGSNACGSSLAAGGSCMIYVTFSPSLTATGVQTGTLTITDNSGGVTGSTQMVNLSGAGVIPIVTLSPSPPTGLIFSSQAKGTTSASQPVNVYNTGSATLNITGIAVSANFGETDNCSVSGGGVITSGSYCTINVTFSPSLTATVGTLTGTLTITDNNNGVPGSTQTVSLSGTATAAILPPAVVTDNETITVTDTPTFPDVFDNETINVADTVFVTPIINVGAGVAFISAGSVGFGSVAAGQTGTQIVTLSNIGEAPLTLTSATLSASSAFTITQIVCSNGATSLPTTLPVGGACDFTISYTAPTGSTPSATLTFTDSAALSNLTSTKVGSSFTQTLSLSGTGTTTPPPAAPPAIVPVVDNETITVTDTPTFPDVYDQEAITVTDTVSVVAVPLISGTLSANSLSFGNEDVGSTSSNMSVTLTSSGTASLTITSITASGDYALVPGVFTCPYTGGTLNPGDECGIYVTFTPTTTGTRTGSVTITDNNGGTAGSTQTISLTGTGVANTPTGTDVTASVTSSAGAPPATVEFASVTKAGTTTVSPSTACSTSTPANFSVGSAGGAGTCVDVSTTAVFSGMITITVSFNPANYPPYPPGPQPQIFHLVNGVWQNVTVSVNYSNDTITAQVSSLSPFGIFVGMPAVSLPATPQNFGNLALNTSSSAQQVTLTNSGAANLTISTVTLGGTNASAFAKSADNCTGATVTPNGTCTVNVTFTPAATGALSATLTFTDNAATSPQTLALSGTGVDFAMAPAPTSATQTVAQGGNAQYTINVTSLGGTDSNAVTLACSNLPAQATCAFSPATVTPGASGSSSTLTITTAAPVYARMIPPSSGLPPARLLAMLLAMMLLVLVGWWRVRRQSPRWAAATCLLFGVLLAATFMASCAQGGYLLPKVGGTPTGSYTVTITGSFGSTQHTTTVTLNVTGS